MNNRRNIILIILAGICVYFNSLSNGFVWDDIHIVVNNDFIKGFSLWKQILLKPLFYFSSFDYPYYRPVQSFFNLLDYSFWGLRPFGFHLTNLLLHICAAAFFYFFVALLSQDRRAALFSGILFVVHPLNSSVVNYISARADILLALFSVSSLILFLKADRAKTYLLSLVCFGFALLSKETAVILPLCVIFTSEMYEKIRHVKAGSKFITARIWYAAFFVVLAAYVFLRSKALGLKSDILPAYKAGFLESLITSSNIVLNYLKLIFFPFNLHMLRAVGISSASSINIALFAFFSFLCIFILWKIYKKNKIIFFALGLFLIWVSPAGNMAFRFPEYNLQHRAIMAEHWLYIASVGIFMAIFYSFDKLKTYLGGAFNKALIILLVLYFSIITVKQNVFWKNNSTFFNHTAEYVRYSPSLYRNLGRIYLNKNDVKKAIDMYTRALELEQDSSRRIILYADLAFSHLLNNQEESAIEAIRLAEGLKGNKSNIHALLGLVYSKKDPRRAAEEWKLSLETDYLNKISFDNLLALSGKDESVRGFLIEKFSVSPERRGYFEEYKKYTGSGIIYLYSGFYSYALPNLKKAFEINPYNTKTLNALAVYYAQTEDFYSAIKLFNTALRLNPFDTEIYRNLAALYKQLNQPEEAQLLIEKSESANIYN